MQYILRFLFLLLTNCFLDQRYGMKANFFMMVRQDSDDARRELQFEHNDIRCLYKRWPRVILKWPRLSLAMTIPILRLTDNAVFRSWIVCLEFGVACSCLVCGSTLFRHVSNYLCVIWIRRSLSGISMFDIYWKEQWAPSFAAMSPSEFPWIPTYDAFQHTMHSTRTFVLQKARIIS